MVHHASIIIVPPDLLQLTCELVVSEHGIPRRGARAVERAGFACGVCRDLHLGQECICIGVEFLEDRRDVEAIDEEGGAARAVRVREEMEELEATWVGLGILVVIGGICRRVHNLHSRWCQCGQRGRV
jgi:hypothetical protein